MPFIDTNLGDDIKEKECAPEGAYDLVIEDYKINDKEYESNGQKTTGKVIEVFIAIDGASDDYRIVRHYLSLPNSLDDKDKARNKALGIKRFMHLCGIPFDASGFNTDDLPGTRFRGNLSVEVDESGKYTPQNRLEVPALPKETA